MNSEKDEIPKAMQNINNTDKVEKADNIEQKEKIKKSFVKRYIIFILLLIMITVVAIVITIILTKKPEDNIAKESTDTQQLQTKKSKAKDAYLGISNYSETYNENSINILTYIDINGDIGLFNINSRNNGQDGIEFVQISGLKDKEIENKVNEKLKNASYNLGMKNVYSYVTANFSNILSVTIYGFDQETEHNKQDGVNIDLTTGDDIPFEKVFVSSAPINSYLTEGLYETLAWYTKYIQEQNAPEEYVDRYDMDKADISDYEDKSIMLIKNFQKAKEKGTLKYIITPSNVIIYNLLDENIVSKEWLDSSITINFQNKLDEVAIYKRYLNDKNIYENISLGNKNVIVCTESTVGHDTYLQRVNKIINYGKKSNNLYVEEFLSFSEYDTSDEIIDKIEKYFVDNSEINNNNIKPEDGQGMFYHKDINVWKKYDGNYYEAAINEVKVTCSEDYYKNLAFKDFIAMKNKYTDEVGLVFFNTYEAENYPNLTIKDNSITVDGEYQTTPRVFFSLNGEYLGDNEEEAKAKLNQAQ